MCGGHSQYTRYEQSGKNHHQNTGETHKHFETRYLFKLLFPIPYTKRAGNKIIVLMEERVHSAAQERECHLCQSLYHPYQLAPGTAPYPRLTRTLGRVGNCWNALACPAEHSSSLEAVVDCSPARKAPGTTSTRRRAHPALLRRDGRTL